MSTRRARSLSDEEDDAEWGDRGDRRRQSPHDAPPQAAREADAPPQPRAPQPQAERPRVPARAPPAPPDAPEWVAAPPPRATWPAPLLTLTGVPPSADAAALVSALADAGVDVDRADRGEEGGEEGGSTWYVRLPPPADPAADVVAAAEAAAAATGGTLDIDGSPVTVVGGGGARVTLFVANAPSDWLSDDAARRAWAGARLVRATVPAAPSGDHKGYVLLEFACPEAASAAKSKVDGVEAAMKKRRSGGSGGDASAPQQQQHQHAVRLTRAEWAFPRSLAATYARVLYLAGLRAVDAG